MSDRWATATTKLSAAHAKRLSWALKADGHLLAAAVEKDTSPEARKVERLPIAQIPEYLARLILERADPTAAKSMTAWLVRQYGEGKLRLEDLGSAHETLEMFQRYAPKLPEGHRDLGRYQSLAEVWEAVLVLAETEKDRLSSKAQKSLDRDRAYAESRILHQDQDGFTIAVPLTESAAKWWGRGTRWCTASEKDNRFWQYHKKAPLIVLVIPELKDKGKFQIWISRNAIQFMDAADSPVSEVLITEYWPRFKPVVDFSLQRNGGALAYLPKRLRTDATCRIAVARNGRALKYVPENLRTEEMCRIAVKKDGRALEYVPWDLRTDEMCKFAIAQNWQAVEHVPELLYTEELFKFVVKRHGTSLSYVPEKLRTEELCRIAVAQNGAALQYVPEAMRTEDLCRLAVAQDGKALQVVPHALRTEELCRIAVAQYGIALVQVPKTLRNEDLYRVAVGQNEWALDLVPKDLRTKEICRIAVAKNGRALVQVPERLRTEEICRIAVAQDGYALMYVPEHLRDRFNCPAPSPMPEWDISLLDELVDLLETASSPSPLGPDHA